MTSKAHPYRSVLYMPGSNSRALAKAAALPADALILDLEDAVAVSEKAAARDMVCAAVRTGGFGARRVMVRTNGLDTDWGRDDFKAACAAGPDAILVPKIDSASDVRSAADLLADFSAPQQTRLWVMMETPRAMLNAAQIAAASPRLEGMVLGTNDLMKDIGAIARPDRLPLLTGLGLCILAARAEGLVCVDGVYNAFRDTAGLRAECEQGRAIGFDGKTLIHPAQLAVANEVFAPSPAELAEARKFVEAFEQAAARGQGVAVVDGRIVENLHVEAARRTIEKAEMIAALETAGAQAAG
ncbi:MAG: HpcH/HpaI aldolase/citrate lyase family protein [Paracoccaceae bacterium]